MCTHLPQWNVRKLFPLHLSIYKNEKKSNISNRKKCTVFCGIKKWTFIHIHILHQRYICVVQFLFEPSSFTYFCLICFNFPEHDRAFATNEAHILIMHNIRRTDAAHMQMMKIYLKCMYIWFFFCMRRVHKYGVLILNTLEYFKRVYFYHHINCGNIIII